MTQTVHRAPELRDAAGHARRGLIVNHDDGFKLVGFIRTEAGFQIRRRSAAAPIARHVFNVEPDFFRDSLPELRKIPRLKNQHAIAWRQRIHQRRFAASGA